jgi:hypothetical protein
MKEIHKDTTAPAACCEAIGRKLRGCNGFLVYLLTAAVVLMCSFVNAQVTVFNETFNSLAGWTVIGANTNNFWSGTQPASPTGNCLFVSNGSGYGYNNVTTNMIIYKTFSTIGITSGLTLSFDYKCYTSDNDAGVLMFAYGNPLFMASWYVSSSDFNQSPDWTHVSFNLPVNTNWYNNPNLNLGWKWVCNASNSGMAFAVDNFKMEQTVSPLGTFGTSSTNHPYLLEQDNPIISITDLLGRSATSGFVIVQRKFGKPYKTIIK